MEYYIWLITICSVLCACVVLARQYISRKTPVSKEFIQFQRNFLLIFVIANFSDWLQGPYLYIMYTSHGFTMKDISYLFISEFMSSAIFGTFVGYLSDRYGRKKSCMLYFLLSILSCSTKRSNSYTILVFGRILGGIASSILMTSFESWMISAHEKMGFPRSWLNLTFKTASTLNCLTAIIAGFVSTLLAEQYTPIAVFDSAMTLQIAGGILVYFLWNENHGEITYILKPYCNNMLIYLGIVQCVFEAAVYIFVFSWAPILERQHVPDGISFTIFMLCIMSGTQFIHKNDNVEKLLAINIVFASVCFFILSVYPHLVVYSFFEFSYGVYYPLQGIMRAKYIPSKHRGVISNIMRIGVNLIVVFALLQITDENMEYMYTWVGCMLFIAFIVQCFVIKKI